MNEGWSTSRVVTVLFLGAILATIWMVLWSLDHQQEQIVRLERQLAEQRSVEFKVALDDIVVRHEGLPSYAAPIVAPQPEQSGSAGSRGTQAAVPTPPVRSRDGKDAIGRPLQETPGFTLFPPLGTDIPGRTVKRTPDFIPALGGMYLQGQVSEPDKINWYLTNDGLLSSQIDPAVHERLFNVDPDSPQELLPELAVAWESGDDRLTYRFHLRKGVVFSDGSPFDADDVIFTYEMMQDPNVESEHLRSQFDDVESLRKLDQYTIEVRMRRKYWKALKVFGYQLRIHPQEWYEKEIPIRARERSIAPFSTIPGEPGFAEVFNTFIRKMSPGTGPYKWRDGESWETNKHITLYTNESAWVREYNPDHYRIERKRWRIIKDSTSRHEEFRKEKLHVLVVDHNAWEDQLSKDESITKVANHYVYDHIGLLYSYLGFNCRRFPFNDVNVRRAVAHLVDREFIRDELNRGHATIATCPTKPIYPEYSHDIKPYDFNKQKALKILNDSGWQDSDGDGYLDKDGKTLEFEFTTPSGRSFFKTVTTLLQEACGEVGIRCKDDQKEWSLFIQDYYNRDFDLTCLYSSAPDPWLDPFEEFHSSQVGPRAGNAWGWKNAEVDKLLEAMREEFDAEKRAKLHHQFNHIFHEELPQLLLVHGEVGVLLNKCMKGAKIRPRGLRDFDMWIDPADWNK